ncbi:hypothetical protein GCM10008985_26330 [Halococcus dombrowskii]|uniref:Uncharacterized protein n=1 Tax=Halococcus dombrowskii TaxID=179637 RepID=A0AAV3SHU8_HALDO
MMRKPTQGDESPTSRNKVEQMGAVAIVVSAAYVAARSIVRYLMTLASLEQIIAGLLTVGITLIILAVLWLLSIVTSG